MSCIYKCPQNPPKRLGTAFACFNLRAEEVNSGAHWPLSLTESEKHLVQRKILSQNSREELLRKIPQVDIRYLYVYTCMHKHEYMCAHVSSHTHTDINMHVHRHMHPVTQACTYLNYIHRRQWKCWLRQEVLLCLLSLLQQIF